MSVSELEGRRLLVVGASSGSGRASAIAFVRHGAQVAFSARRRGQLDEAVAEAGGGVVVEIDVCDQISIGAGVTEAADRLGGLDGVLYTAGMSPIARLSKLTLEQWTTIFAVNAFGPSLVTAAALPYLSEDSIVAVMSSDSAAQPRHSLVAYAAAKCALEATMEGWRTEEIGGRRFLTVVIGPTQPTGFADSFSPEDFVELVPHWQRQGFKTGLLAADDVAEHLATTFASMYAAPTLGIETLLLRAPEPVIAVSDFGGSTLTDPD